MKNDPDGTIRRATFVHGAVLIWVFALIAVALPVRMTAQEEDLGPLDPASEQRFSSKMISGYEGTPAPVVAKMLELAAIRPNELVYDLGSGDGRILIAAVQNYGARGLGIELDPRRCRQSIEKIQRLGLRNQIQIIEGDVLEQDLSAADVVTIYLTPYGVGLLKPQLEKYLHHGMRIVLCESQIPGWKPASTVSVVGDNKRTYTLTLYVISKPNDWVSFSKFGRTH